MAKEVRKKTITETIDEDGSKKTTVKEHAPKKTEAKKKTQSKSKSKQRRRNPSNAKQKNNTAAEREKLLIENFVGLQHAMTNMSIKFGTLSDNISKLLSVFEEAAKGFVVGDKVDDEQMLDKIDSLLDQNKTIAKGLVLMEEKVRTRMDHTEEAEKLSNEADKFSMQEVKPKSEELRKPNPFMNPQKPSMGDFRPSMPERPPIPSKPSMSDLNTNPMKPKPLPRI